MATALKTTGASKRELLELCKKQEVNFLRLQFTDILGVNKNVEVPERQFEKALEGDIMFDGSSIEGFVRIEESDMVLKPDLDTFQVLPYDDEGGRIARLICDIYNPDGSSFAGRTTTAAISTRRPWTGPRRSGVSSSGTWSRWGSRWRRATTKSPRDSTKSISATRRRSRRRTTWRRSGSSSATSRTATASSPPSCPSRSTARTAPACTRTSRSSRAGRTPSTIPPASGSCRGRPFSTWPGC